MIDFLFDVFEQNETADAVVWRDKPFRYRWLADTTREWIARLEAEDVAPGTVVVLEGDFSPTAIALFLALIEQRCIVVPLTRSVAEKHAEFIGVAEAEVHVCIDDQDDVTISRLSTTAAHPHYEKLRADGHAGLVLFTSGSTGKSKAAVHDFVPLLAKFRTPRHQQRAITFLLLDHIGGVNTMLYQLSNGGCIVTVEGRKPDEVLGAVAKHNVNLLPASPTFLRLMLLSKAIERYDLSCLQTITYGTEPMPEPTLKQLHAELPNVRLLQTYGLSELGILRSKSQSSESLWVKVGGEDFRTRVVEGVLHIQAESAMLGYLNAPSPFLEGGWYNTGDLVEQDGDYIRFLGRESEIINVGGEKVFPAEVEAVIEQLDEIADAVVFSEQSPLVGNIVCAQVKLTPGAAEQGIQRRVKSFCTKRLPRFKVPVKVTVMEGPTHNGRFKKLRRPQAKAPVS